MREPRPQRELVVDRHVAHAFPPSRLAPLRRQHRVLRVSHGAHVHMEPDGLLQVAAHHHHCC
eukprot:3632232-Heterocapsa_arctica.AAC.1